MISLIWKDNQSVKSSVAMDIYWLISYQAGSFYIGIYFSIGKTNSYLNQFSLKNSHRSIVILFDGMFKVSRSKINLLMQCTPSWLIVKQLILFASPTLALILTKCSGMPKTFFRNPNFPKIGRQNISLKFGFWNSITQPQSWKSELVQIGLIQALV